MLFGNGEDFAVWVIYNISEFECHDIEQCDEKIITYRPNLGEILK